MCVLLVCFCFCFCFPLSHYAIACARSRHGGRRKASIARADRKINCHCSQATDPHSLSEMGVGRPITTELLGCCPLPSKESALSYSLVRGAPLHAGFSNNLGALFRLTRARHRQHQAQEKVFLVIKICRLRLCHAEPNCCLSELGQPSPVTVVFLVALAPPCPCLRGEQLR